MANIYVIGSLRNPEVPKIANKLREAGHSAFDDWYSAGPEADDYWRNYEIQKGHNFKEALDGYAARNVFNFDKTHLDRCDISVLVLPAGKSGHLELGYFLGCGKPGFILLDETPALPPGWKWVAGIYEGEGSISYNRGRNKQPQNLVMSLTSNDKDVIEKLYETTSVGNIQGPYYNKANNLVKKPEIIKPSWRWSVYKKEDILYIINGIWGDLSERRKKQILDTLKKCNIYLDDIEIANSPYEFRFDVMYQFATGVYHDINELISELAKNKLVKM